MKRNFSNSDDDDDVDNRKKRIHTYRDKSEQRYQKQWRGWEEQIKSASKWFLEKREQFCSPFSYSNERSSRFLIYCNDMSNENMENQQKEMDLLKLLLYPTNFKSKVMEKTSSTTISSSSSTLSTTTMSSSNFDQIYLFGCGENFLSQISFESKTILIQEDFIQWFEENYDIKASRTCIYFDLSTFEKLNILLGEESMTSLAAKYKDSWKSKVIDIAIDRLDHFLHRDNPVPMLIIKTNNSKSDPIYEELIKKLKNIETRKTKMHDGLIEGYEYFVLVSQVVKVTELKKKQQKMQFMTVWNHKSDLRRRLTQLIEGQTKYNRDMKIKLMDCIRQCVFECRDDKYIYDELFELYHEHAQNRLPNSVAEKSDRSDHRVTVISNMLPHSFHPKSILDIGCAEGSITSALGKHFGLDIKNIHGCDVRDVPLHEGFQFTLIEGDSLKQYQDKSQSLVVSLMALHHMNDPMKMIKEIHRVLEPGGYFFIREHDCTPADFSSFLDILHGLYAMVWYKPREMPDFCENYFAHYRSKIQWDDMMLSAGFIVEKDGPVEGDTKAKYGKRIKNVIRAYHTLYKKS